FGGINVIFAGDFFQYPPIAGTPLYAPISKSTKISNLEIKKRLGRLAWKTINIVVSLEEQQRMKDDTGYAEAVRRLRVRKCNLEDLDLFNSRLIKSASYPQGIDMKMSENQQACAIISTNLLRETINIRKAKSNCAMDPSKKLVVCAALDKITPTPSESDTEIYMDLLKLDVSRFSSEGALPGFISLYEGMPVILRNRNLSTELGITNGAQGTLRQINCEVGFSQLTSATSVIVEFPRSRVHLPHLPEHYFPITAITWHFSTTLTNSSGNQDKYRVVRQQLPIQPAFAVTGQSAQGKT
ncbi:hypothetical protein BJ138DRAFT_974232, partial [Hygrophoropsis aurantiaca]